MAEARQVLRELLRAVNKHVTSVSGNTLWKDHVVQEFRRHAAETDSGRVASQLQTARDCRFLLVSVHAHKELLFSYNIGTNRDKGKLQKRQETANACGLQLPEEAAA